MVIEDKQIIQLPRETAWEMLMDPTVLAKLAPGITSLEKIDEDHYKAVAELKMGPFGGTFSGTLSITDRQEPEKFSLNILADSKMGTAKAALRIVLAEITAQETEAHYEGEIKLSGMLAFVGGRGIIPIAKMLVQQFFGILEKEAAARPQ